jgi:hypothetical protein
MCDCPVTYYILHGLHKGLSGDQVKEVCKALQVAKFGDDPKSGWHELRVDLRSWPYWRDLVDDELVRKLCAVNPELTQLQLDFFVVDSSCDTLDATVTDGSGDCKNILVQFPIGEYTLESFLAYLQQQVEKVCSEMLMKIKLSVKHWLVPDLSLHEMNACCSFELIHDSTTKGVELILKNSSTLMQLPGWKKDIVICAGEERKVTTKATSAVAQQLVQDKLVISKQICHEQLVISTPVLQDELLVESPFVGNRTETVELGLKQPVWKSYARRYTNKSPSLAKLSNSIRSSDAKQKCEVLAIANHVFEEAKQKSTLRPQRQLQPQPLPRSKPQRRQQQRKPPPKPKIKTVAELCENDFVVKLRKCTLSLPQDNSTRIKQSGLVGVNLLSHETGPADGELAKQLQIVASGQRDLELCLLHDVHHSLSDVLLILHDGTKSVHQVFGSMEEHSNLLLPAICVLYGKGRGDKGKFECFTSSGENVMVIDHPDPKLAPMFLVKVATGCRINVCSNSSNV